MLHVVSIELNAEDVFAKTAVKYAVELVTDDYNSTWDVKKRTSLRNMLLRSGTRSTIIA